MHLLPGFNRKIDELAQLIVMYSNLFAHGLREQIDIREGEIVAIIKQHSFEGLNASVVVDVDASGVDNAHLPCSFRDAVIDRFGEGRMDEVEVQKNCVLLIGLKL